MMEDLGVQQKDVARWVGTICATFSLCQSVAAIPWGRASDKFGRKPTILAGMSCTMVTSILFGFSKTLPMAIAVRVFAGLGNGNIGIIRTSVAEMVPEKELQPRAFSIMPLVWTIGSIFGPAFGGFLAKPAQHFPNLFENCKFLIE